MALIRRFKEKKREKYKTHQPIDANYYILGRDGRKLLQIDTFGRSTRQNPGKQSQTIQLDKAGARSLFNILKRSFDFE